MFIGPHLDMKLSQATLSEKHTLDLLPVSNFSTMWKRVKLSLAVLRRRTLRQMQ